MWFSPALICTNSSASNPRRTFMWLTLAYNEWFIENALWCISSHREVWGRQAVEIEERTASAGLLDSTVGMLAAVWAGQVCCPRPLRIQFVHINMFWLTSFFLQPPTYALTQTQTHTHKAVCPDGIFSFRNPSCGYATLGPPGFLDSQTGPK